MSNSPVCPIWGTSIEKPIPVLGEIPKDLFASPRAGGKYIANFNLQRDLERLECDERVKARLTTWLIDQRELGKEHPEIDAEVIKMVKQRKDLSVVERANRLLRAMEKRVPRIGDFVELQHHIDSWLAYSESTEKRQVEYIVEHLVNQRWLSPAHGYPARTVYQITVRGHAHLAELNAGNNESEQVFVAMWLDEAMNAAWKEGIQPAVKEAGYTPHRIDQEEFIDKIDDRITAKIRQSRFLVADFTGHRGGVYYEAGFAHGLDIPVIFSCREDHFDEIHFDTRQYNCIGWKGPEDLKDSLVKRICAAIGDGPLKT